MSYPLQDFLDIKNEQASRLLKPSIEAGVLRHIRPIHVATAAAIATRNIHAIGVGFKIVAGKHTKDLCIRIYVFKKLPKSLISPHFQLAEMLDGLPTDIIESEPTQLLSVRKNRDNISKGTIDKNKTTSNYNNSTDDLTSIQRPLFGGISTANSDVLAGTLGCFCKSASHEDDSNYILSNRHVLGIIEGEPGDNKILQPSVGDGGTRNEWIADYIRAAPIDLSPGGENKVDAAIAKIHSSEDNFKSEVSGIGQLGPPIDVALDDIVRKCGKATGVTRGIVRDISYSHKVWLDYDLHGRSIYFINQIGIGPIDQNAFINPGDSGAIVVADSSNSVIGLICGGDPAQSLAVANRIQDVLEVLEINLL